MEGNVHEAQYCSVRVHLGHAVRAEGRHVHEIPAGVEDHAGGLRQCDAEVRRIGGAAIGDVRIQIDRRDRAGSDLNVRNAVIYEVSAQVRFEHGQVERVGVRHEDIAVGRVYGESQIDGSHARVIRNGWRAATHLDGGHAIVGHRIFDKRRVPCRIAGRHDESHLRRRRQGRIHGGDARVLRVLRGRSAWRRRSRIRDERGSVSS